MPCPDCPRTHSPMSGNGPEPAEYLLISERPGFDDLCSQQICSGKAGRELDRTYLPKANLERFEVAVSNVVCCFGERTPTDKEIKSCAWWHLPARIDRVQPEVLIIMGASACKIIDRAPDQPQFRLDTYHGRPIWGSVLDGQWEGWIWPSYHPSAGMRDGKYMTWLLEDFTRLGDWRAGRWAPPSAPAVKKDYQYVADGPEGARQIKQYFVQSRHIHGAIQSAPGLDTESHGKNMFSVQVSFAPHTGRMILAHQREVLSALNELIQDLEVVMHFAPHDIRDSAKMGVFIRKFRDTMQEAFQLCSLPQGLKPLVYQTLGIEMISWEDTVWPASIYAIRDWMEAAVNLLTAMPAITRTELKMKLCSVCGKKTRLALCKGCEKLGLGQPLKTQYKYEEKPQIIESALRHILRFTKVDGEYSPWEKWSEVLADGFRSKKLEGWEEEFLVDELGSSPILGIGNCDKDQALQYAVGDSDLTGQIAPILEQMRHSSKWEISEGDVDRYEPAQL